MKKTILTICALMTIVFFSASITSCNNEQAETKEESVKQQDDDGEHLHADVYQCPMKCEGDKTYAEAGKCPECGMDLEKINGDHDDHDHENENGDEHDHEHEDGDEHTDNDSTSL